MTLSKFKPVQTVSGGSGRVPLFITYGASLYFLIILQYKKELIEEFSDRIVPQFANGTLKTIVDSVFTIDEIQLAHKRMESNENIGKIVLQIM